MISPENVLLSIGGDGRVVSAYLIDFGRCVYISENEGNRFRGGVWELMPEAQHNGEVTTFTDLQSLCALLAMLLLGTAPFYPGHDVYRKTKRRADKYKDACKELSGKQEQFSRIRDCIVEMGNNHTRDAGTACGIPDSSWSATLGDIVLTGLQGDKDGSAERLVDSLQHCLLQCN